MGIGEGSTVTGTQAAPLATRSRAADERVGADAGVTGEELRRGLARARRSIDHHAAALTRLDAVLGDGDHGDNMAIGFRAVEELVAELPPETPPGDLLRAVGHRLVATVGGASGPLYGTAFIEAGFRAGDASRLDPGLVGEMLRAATAGLARRGRCAIGDKTMFDALAPATEAVVAALATGATADEAARAGIRAARRGMRGTRDMVARRGLALRLGERSRGHVDPGAASCLLLLLALARR